MVKLVLALVAFVLLTWVGLIVWGVALGALGVPEILVVMVFAAAVTAVAYRRTKKAAV